MFAVHYIYSAITKFGGSYKFVIHLSGALGSSSSYLEQARGYTSSPVAALRPKMSTPGNRLLHTSCPLSSAVANRPLSPHLPLKKPQFSATFSISHRIFGVALGVAIISVPLATKFSLMFGV
jgi:succinate dehydrogenase (ubiquinone) cytochrome b560 subunit